MKLTIIRLTTLSDQDRICLSKIWPGVTAADLPLDDTHRLYAARFNERLLAAVRVTLNGNQGVLDDLCVREITRRRGVGQYLIEEVMHDNPQVSRWVLSRFAAEESLEMAAFAKALGFAVQIDGWVKE
ncbi:aspartate 1-decarboxylase autocleavage activator PanM [Kluyvera cryocrescens]|uniref:PanD regulatory factor n=1 Tax=Kluyvera cryocrescens TaxID=580 RepID=A0A485AP43_KLUCR|nr:aspartate 1-decarboxylase autocleavage activator PanM [Kluyvera cryocrescens]VFS62755.1 Acetyltransferase, GNAT family [Kluyvera cryocrescens]